VSREIFTATFASGAPLLKVPTPESNSYSSDVYYDYLLGVIKALVYLLKLSFC